MAADVQFCHPPSSTSLLAAIGVIGSFERAEFRASHRALWSRANVPCSLVVRFVLRGLGASRAMRGEAAAHNDVTFVRAPEDGPRARSWGPLVSLVGWYECALTAWPRARLLGKAEDDVWLHLPGVEAHLLRTLESLQRAGVAAPEERLYWGVMEQYSLLHEPNASLRGHPFVGFGFRPAKRACADRRGGEGPFSFAKGPLHALSAPLAAQLVAARPFEEYVARVRAHPDEEDGAAAHYFEDAFTGWAVSKFARGDNLTVVHAGQFLYWDQWGSHYQGPRRGTVIFHARLKNGGVMRRADDMTAFARTQHCAPRRIELPCYEPMALGCNGEKWRVCYANPAAFEPPGCDARAICANFTCAPAKEAAAARIERAAPTVEELRAPYCAG